MFGFLSEPIRIARIAFAALVLLNIATLALLGKIFLDLKQTRSFVIDASSASSSAAEAAEAARAAANAAEAEAKIASCFAEHPPSDNALDLPQRPQCRPLDLPAPPVQSRPNFP